MTGAGLSGGLATGRLARSFDAASKIPFNRSSHGYLACVRIPLSVAAALTAGP